jgi:antitoxin component of MazEF toxin-antitoxin module
MSVSTSVRKVNVLNNCTLAVSIPKDAIEKLSITKGDLMRCSVEGDKLVYERIEGVVA